MRALPLLLAGVLAGCLPTRNASVSIPLASADGKDHERALVRLPFGELAARLPGMRKEELGFYARGRDPVPYLIVDANHDGRPDEVVLVVPVAGDGSTRILATCPAPRAVGTVSLDTALPTATADFSEAKR